MRIKFWLSVIVMVTPFISPLGAHAAEPDWTVYGVLLEEYVVEGSKDGVALNLVDYTGLDRDPRFQQLVADIRGYDVATLAGREETLAFYINAYNILTIALILDNWPLDSIRDIGNFFRGPWDVVMLENSAGRLSLDDIEHGLIRPLGEPRIHFAVNCASVSCPDLRREPYTASRLDSQLDDQARRFLAEPHKGLSVKQGVAHISRIFDWYGEDFDGVGGVEAFVRQYVDSARGLEFKGVDADLKYNWRLNGQ